MSISSPVWLEDGSDKAFREVVYNLLSLSAMVLRSRERFAAYIGVTAPQYSIMMVVAEAGSATVGQVAAALHVTSPFATAELGKLERRGLIEKRPSETDARSSLVSLTPLARRLIAEVGPMRRMLNDAVYGSLNAIQARQLKELVGTLQANAVRALHELDGPDYKGAVSPSADKARR